MQPELTHCEKPVDPKVTSGSKKRRLTSEEQQLIAAPLAARKSTTARKSVSTKPHESSPKVSPKSNSDKATITNDSESALARIHSDEHGRVCRVQYPNSSKERIYKRDPLGRVIAVTTSDDQGVRTLTAEGERWFIELEGQKVFLPGKIIIKDSGEFLTELNQAGVWRAESTDGIMTHEKRLIGGVTIGVGLTGEIKRITRSDTSSVTAVYADGAIVEFRESSSDQEFSWLNKDGRWICEQWPQLQRQAFELHANGNTTWLDESGSKHIVRSNGIKIVERTGSAQFSFDDCGRIESIRYPDGRRVRKFTYQENSTSLIKVAVQENTGIARIYTLVIGTTWQITDGNGKKLGSWIGHIDLSSDGAYSVKPEASKADPIGHWKTYRPDGLEVQEYRNEDGSRTIYLKDGRLHCIIRSDNSYVKLEYASGKLAAFREFNRVGEKTEFRRRPGTSIWTSDSNGTVCLRKNMQFKKFGECCFIDEHGQLQTHKTDGTVAVQMLESP